jgi:hypothetical protein
MNEGGRGPVGREKRRLTRAYKATFLIIRSVINEHDPVGLMEAGCPDDEYDAEVTTILARLPRASSVDDVKMILYQEFDRAFGPSSTRPSAYESASRDVWQAWITSPLGGQSS